MTSMYLSVIDYCCIFILYTLCTIKVLYSMHNQVLYSMHNQGIVLYAQSRYCTLCTIKVLYSMHDQGQIIILQYLEKVVTSIVNVTIMWLLFQHLNG